MKTNEQKIEKNKNKQNKINLIPILWSTPYQALIKPLSGPYQALIRPLSSPCQALVKPLSSPYSLFRPSWNLISQHILTNIFWKTIVWISFQYLENEPLNVLKLIVDIFLTITNKVFKISKYSAHMHNFNISIRYNYMYKTELCLPVVSSPGREQFLTP